MTKYLGLADLLLIGEAALKVPAEDVYRICDIGRAESALAAPAACFGDYEAYPTIARKAAVLAFRLCRNHSLLDGNKRVAYLAMCEFIERNGYAWTPPEADGPNGDATVKVIWGVAAGQITEEELTTWVAERIGETL